MSSEVIFALGFVMGILVGGMVAIFLLACFGVGRDE